MNDVIIQNGKTFSAVNITGTHKTLPVGNYLLRYEELTDTFKLETQADFSLPPKIYGDLSYVNRWKKSFENTTKNLGILLSGYKGNGKTLTAQYFCQMMNRPVIFITKGYTGATFESFITNPVFHNSIIFIDEYEKLYNEGNDNEDTLLSMMDGIYNTHLIFLLTVNNSRYISDKLKNRLGRIRYHKQYSSVEDSVIQDAIEDLLVNKDFKQSIIEVLDQTPTISLDILMSLIKEVNLFDEPATVCIKHLNVVKEEVYYEVSVFNGKLRRFCHSRSVSLPDGTCAIYYADDHNPKATENWPYGNLFLKNYTLDKISGGFKFKYDDKYEITLIRSDIESFLIF